MKLIITIKEIFDLDIVEEICEVKGYDPYRLKLCPEAEEIILTIQQAKELRLI